MLQSMTGFGSASFKIDELEIEIEIKTLNSKYLDSKVLLPNVISAYELELNKLLKDNLIRGKVDLRIKFSDIANESVKFNKEVISKYINELKEVSDFDESQLLKNVLSLPNSITKEENIIKDNLKTRIFECVNKVIGQVIKFREIEGSNTKNDLLDNLDKLDSFKVNLERISNDHRAQVEEDLKSKIDNLNVELDYGRIEQELFYYLEKIDINEEIVRLNSHLKFFSDVLNNSEVEKGKKLGFICQEIGREINTIGSKANNSSIQSNVVEMKTLLEKLKEQLLNII
jgi:uncharacterized protein (TIGR00255 family)